MNTTTSGMLMERARMVLLGVTLCGGGAAIIGTSTVVWVGRTVVDVVVLCR